MGVHRVNPPPPPERAGTQAVTAQALREQYESGATVAELVATSGLSYGTVLNRLREAGTEMRTSWQTRRMRDGQARRNLAARLRRLYEQQGATLTELAAAGSVTRRVARRLLIEAGGRPRTTQHTLRIRAAADAARRRKLAAGLRARYEAGASVPELAKECNYSLATVYRLLHQAGTRMRPQHRHGPARRTRKRS
ncbi:helix-turn-helix domain-containing protein [Streptomyces umbrinus]|uniref:helix-turn-helix domain-containing protein n=1 Tax=Streptomyces umbrinus TaxID=67370 RepID=UPI003C2ECAEE